MSGRLIGVGTGPGDPELLTLKAVRALAEADVVAHFAKAGAAAMRGRRSAGFLRPDVIELPLLYPVTTEIADGTSRLWRGDRRLLSRVGGGGRGASRGRAHGGGAERGRSAVLRLLHAPACAAGAALSGRGHPRRHRDVGLLVAGRAAARAGRRRADRAAGHAARGRAGAAARRQRGGGDHEGRPQPAARSAGRWRRRASSSGRSMSSAAPWQATAMRAAGRQADDEAPYFSLVLVPGWEGRP